MLKHFKLDTYRDSLYPSIQCYQMPLIGIVNEALADGAIEELLPSWAKFIANPMKAKGFFVYVLQAIFSGKTNSTELNIDYQMYEQGGYVAPRRVAMLFLPENTKTAAIHEIVAISREAIPEVKVVVIAGSKNPKDSFSRGTTNREAEKKIKEVIEMCPNSSILIIASKMAQRSFSIPEITELYLAYDNGSNGGTIQKMSRALTPSDSNKIGRIFSLSFDPNRDDKFDAMVLAAALAIRAREGQKDIKKCLQKVLRSVDIFKCTKDGPIKFEAAEFIEQCLKRKSVSRVLGKTADVSKLTDDIRVKLAAGIINVKQLDKVAAATRGKTKEFSDILTRAKNNSNIEPSEKELAKVRAMLATIIENVDFIVDGTETENISDALRMVREWGEESQVEDEFGVPFEAIEFVFNNGIINQDMVNIKLELID